MGDKADELVKQLLEKSEHGMVTWHSVPEESTESYRADIEDGFSFWIRRNVDGDDKVIRFALTRSEGTVLSKVVDNMLAGRVRFEYSEKTGGNSAFPKVNQFRLYSDLFHAARKNAVREDQTIERVQQILERLGGAA